MSSIDTKRYSEILHDVYDCVTEPSHWQVVVRKICEELDLNHGVLGCYAFPNGNPLLRVQHGVPAIYFERMPEYGEEMGSFWGGPERIAGFPIGEVTLHSVVQPDFDILRNRFALEWCQPQNIQDFAAATLAVDDRTLSSLVFGSTRLLERERPYELELLRLLMPHIRRALSISRFLDLKAIENAELAAAFATLPNGLLLVDANASILFANNAATNLIKDSAGLMVSDGRLTLRDPRSMNALVSALAGIAGGGPIDERGSGIPVRGSTGHWVTLHVLPLRYGRMHRTLDTRAIAAVFMLSNHKKGYLLQDALRTLYGLTPAEIRVSELIAEGFAPSEIAMHIGVAVSTVRTHLNRIFEKTNVRRQVDLVRLVTSLQIDRRAD